MSSNTDKTDAVSEEVSIVTTNTIRVNNVEEKEGAKYEGGIVKNVWESTKKFFSFSFSHHTKMLNIIKADGKGSINPVKIMKFRINPFRKVDIAKPSVIFGNIRGKTLPLYLKPRIERLQNFKLDGLKDKKLQKIFGRDFNKIEEVKHRYKGLAGEALWEKLAENDPEAYRQLMLEQSGLRGGRYVAETVQNGIKIATLGIAGYTALSGGLAIGAGMLIGSRLLAMVSYPMGQAFTNYYDKLAGRGYSTAEKVQAMVVNLPTAIIGGILGYKAAEIIGSASSEILSKITNSNTVRYGLNTLSRILLMAGSGAATNIVSGILQSEAYQYLIRKADSEGDNEKKQKLERMKKISNAVGTMMNPLVSSLGALSASIPETMESIQHQIESFENANTFDPSETISNTNKLAENNNQPLGGLAPGMQMLNPLGNNSDLGPTQGGTQTRLFTELNGSAGGLQSNLIDIANYRQGEVGGGTAGVGDISGEYRQNNFGRANFSENSGVVGQTQTATPTPQAVDLNLSQMIEENGGGPTEWRTAAGLVEESINYIRTNDTETIQNIFKQINIDLSPEQISEIQGGTISEDTIKDLLRASVVMQQGSNLYPNGSTGSIFSNFIERANAENGGGVLDGYARLNDAPTDNPYKTVQGILEDNKTDIESKLSRANVAVGDNDSTVDTEIGRRGNQTENLWRALGEENQSNTSAPTVDTYTDQTVLLDQYMNDYIQRINNAENLTPGEKTELVNFLRILREDNANGSDPSGFRSNLRDFFNGREPEPRELFQVMQTAQAGGYYDGSTLKSEVQYEAMAKTFEYRRLTWDMGDKDLVFGDRKEADDKVSLLEFLNASKEKGTIGMNETEFTLSMRQFYEEQRVLFTNFWNDLSPEMKLVVGAGGVLMLFMSQEILRYNLTKFLPVSVSAVTPRKRRAVILRRLDKAIRRFNDLGMTAEATALANRRTAILGYRNASQLRTMEARQIAFEIRDAYRNAGLNETLGEAIVGLPILNRRRQESLNNVGRLLTPAGNLLNDIIADMGGAAVIAAMPPNDTRRLLVENTQRQLAVVRAAQARGFVPLGMTNQLNGILAELNNYYNININNLDAALQNRIDLLEDPRNLPDRGLNFRGLAIQAHHRIRDRLRLPPPPIAEMTALPGIEEELNRIEGLFRRLGASGSTLYPTAFSGRQTDLNAIRQMIDNYLDFTNAQKQVDVLTIRLSEDPDNPVLEADLLNAQAALSAIETRRPIGVVPIETIYENINHFNNDLNGFLDGVAGGAGNVINQINRLLQKNYNRNLAPQLAAFIGLTPPAVPPITWAADIALVTRIQGNLAAGNPLDSSDIQDAVDVLRRNTVHFGGAVINITVFNDALQLARGAEDFALIATNPNIIGDRLERALDIQNRMQNALIDPVNAATDPRNQRIDALQAIVAGGGVLTPQQQAELTRLQNIVGQPLMALPDANLESQLLAEQEIENIIAGVRRGLRRNRPGRQIRQLQIEARNYQNDIRLGRALPGDPRYANLRRLMHIA